MVLAWPVMGSWAWWVCLAIVMVTSCSARSARMIFLMETPVWAWRWRAMTREAVTTVRWASMAWRVWWKIRRARRSCLDMRKDCFTRHRLC